MLSVLIILVKTLSSKFEGIEKILTLNTHNNNCIIYVQYKSIDVYQHIKKC